MIPKKLTLHNFLSYRQASLDFEGLHTACICGDNGAGKSSLLEAITWAVWGKTRTASDEDLIHIGEKNTRVDFEFVYGNQSYRIIRTKQRKGGSTVDFQVIHSNKYNSISGKGVTETNKKIMDCLKVDYKTFINSAYLKQGKADQFMLNKPTERKQVLADLLKLDEYTEISTKAKDLAKQYNGEKDRLQGKLELLEGQLEEKETINISLTNLEKDLLYHQQEYEKLENNLQEIKVLNSQRKTIDQEMVWQENQVLEMVAKNQDLQEENKSLELQVSGLKILLDEEGKIVNGYQELEQLTEKDKLFNQKFQEYQRALSQKNDLSQQLTQKINNLEQSIKEDSFKLEEVAREEGELLQIIEKKDQIIEDAQQLKFYTEKLVSLDQLLVEFNFLKQRENGLVNELEKEEATLSYQVQQLQKKEDELQVEIEKIPQIREEYFELEAKIEEIENTKNYLTRIEEKITDKKLERQGYILHQKNIAQEILASEQKIATLGEDNAICPLCDTPLDENHLHHVISSTHTEQEKLKSISWQCEENIIKCDRTLQQLKQEYHDLSRELEKEDSLKQNFIKRENLLDSMDSICDKLSDTKTEKLSLINSLENKLYLPQQQKELAEVQLKLANLDYNQETYSMVKKNEHKYHWAGVKLEELQRAEKKLSRLEESKISLRKNVQTAERELEDLQENSPLQLQINQLEEKIREINYSDQHHSLLKSNLEKLQPYQLKYLQLQEAKTQLPKLEEKLGSNTRKYIQYQEEIAEKQLKINKVKEQLSQLFDYSQELKQLESESNDRKSKINQLLSKKGGLEQSLTNLENNEKELLEITEQIKIVQKNQRVYNELVKAFGKNGIQALMIENILPQLEAEANQILSRLTNNQLHIQFVTQKLKANSGKKSNPDFKDTLDIIISDVQGTRSYETYSGGESFRINFSIRLALSRILAQRSGTALQLLIIDEGFGTQDDKGCDRLISALNNISQDFACILTVTHMPQFKEAFQSRIEVYKTDQGSKIRLSV